MNTLKHIFAPMVAIALLSIGAYSQQYQPTNIPVDTYSGDQSETAISVDPNNSNHLMATWNDFNNGTYSKPGFAFSTDGGNSWSVGVIDSSSTALHYGVDPSCAFDRYGNAYYTYIATTSGVSPTIIYISKTTNNGPPWTASQVSTGLTNEDKPYMAVDNTGGSYDGRLYVAWTDFTSGSAIRFAYSTNQGSTWSAPNTFQSYSNIPGAAAHYSSLRVTESPGSVSGTTVQFATPAVGPDGTVYVTFLSTTGGTGSSGTIKIVKSTDGGSTFTQPSAVANTTVVFGWNLVGALRVSTIPTVAVDPSSGNVYVAYTQYDNGDYNIYSTRSTDKGGSWSSPATATQTTSGLQFMPWLTVNSSGVLSLDYYQGTSTSADVYEAESYNNGQSFYGSDIKVTSSSGNPSIGSWTSDYIGATSIPNRTVWPIWMDFRSGSDVNIYDGIYNSGLRLAYDNKSFSSQSTAFNGQRKCYREPSGKLHEVFASGTITGGEIFYRNSTDNGATWNVTTRLSDGTATSLAPCITVGPGPTVIAAWQQTNGSNYNVVCSRSTSGGSNWSGISTIQSNFPCASPGPLPSVSANMNTGSAVVVYRTSSGLRYVYSTSNMASWSGPTTVPNTDGNYNAPSTAFYPVFSPPTDKSNLAYSSSVGYYSCLYYRYFSFESNSWSGATDLSSVLPTSYREHKDPCLAASTSSYTTAHVAWEATLMAPPTPVLVYRKGSSGNFGSQYTVIQYQSANNPSITGVTSDNAWMVFQNSSSGGFSKLHYYLSGGSWIWGSPTYVSSGNYAQLSVGSSNAKYLWTAGTSSPYTISIGTETLNKLAPLAFDYSRELNFIDAASGASISVEMRQPKILYEDGTVSLIPFVSAPPDSVVISPQEILNYGSTQPFAASIDIDTLRLQCSVRTIKQGKLFQKANGSFSLGIFDENTGRLLGTIANRPVAEVVDSTNQVYDVLGREVKTLISEDQSAGYHSVVFDASKLPSGVYFYRLTAPGIIEVKKMILMK